ncbi:MAG TPA: hypothetical protein VF963_07665 [Gaiellaceae bacterium]
MDRHLENRGKDESSPERREERCTAPHPARAFLLSLPAFVLVTVFIVVLWRLFF